MAEKLSELEEWARDLLASARVARLGLLDDRGEPRVLPVTFALCDGALWTAIDRKPKRADRPARLRYVSERPEVAITVDHYEDDWSRLAWVQVLGLARVHDPADAGAALAALVDKYEPYRREPPPGPLIEIEPRRAIAWRAAES